MKNTIKKLRWIILSLAFTFTLSNISIAQYIVKGMVIDKETKEGLIGVNVVVKGTSTGTATDINSEFELKSNKPIKEIQLSYTGYEPVTVEVNEEYILVRMEQTPLELDQIVVTATRDKQERKDAPVAMTKIQTAELNDLKANFHGQILTQVSSIHYADFGNEQQSMAIRQPLSFSRTQTIILEDGVPIGPVSLTTSGDMNEINLSNIKSIEVLRGPTSSLYGSEAIGGAINFITKNPSAVPTAGASIQASNFGYKKASFEASNTFGKLGIYTGGYYAQRRDGYRDHTDFDKLSLSLKAVYTLSFKTKLTFKTTVNDFTTDFSGSLDSLHFYTQDEFNYHTFSYVHDQSIRSDLRLDHYWNENNKSFFTVLYRDKDNEEIPSYRIRLSGTYPNFKYLGEYVKTDYRSLGFIGQHKTKLNFWESSLIGGVSLDYSPENYYSEVIDVTRTKEGIYTDYTMTGSPVQDFQANIMNTAAYIHFEASPIEKLKLLAALRYDRLDYEYDNNLPPTAESGAEDTKNHFDKVSPKIGLTYAITDITGAYANFSVGFAPPLFSQLYKTVKVPVLSPATYYNYEIGGWTGFLGEKGYFDFAVYLTNGTNEIVEVFEAGASVNKSVGKSQHYGVEYSVKYKIIKDLCIRFSGTNASHLYVDFDEGTNDYSGNDMSFAPKFIGNGGLTYKPSFLKGFRIGAEFQKVSSYYMDDLNSEKYDGYAIFNIRTGYRIKGFELWLNVLNLTDELYAARVSKSYYGNPANPIISYAYSPGIHRTFVLGLAYNFAGK